jgi:alkaline phosphatase D
VRKAATEIFRIFYAQEPDFKKLFTGPGTAHWLHAFQMNFALMDNRSFRSPEDVADPADKTHWGSAQERWLHTNLEESPRPTWILNGDQIFGAYHPFESYERQHPVSLKEQLSLLASQPAPIVFLTGDRHLTEVMSIQGENEILPTFEITTSPIHARVFPSRWENEPNFRQVEGVAGKMNYMIIATQNAGGSLEAKLTAYSVDNEILFHRFLSIEKKTKKLITK